jgi:hypothetical protein
MAGWYRVVKTIKGHTYLYLQQTYREGGQVRTLNRYLGPVAVESTRSPKAGQKPAVPRTPLFTDAGDFARAMASQFDAAQWGKDTGAQLLGQGGKRSRRTKARQPVTTTPKAELSDIGREAQKYTTWPEFSFRCDHGSCRIMFLVCPLSVNPAPLLWRDPNRARREA